jgi:hypothetical protein
MSIPTEDEVFFAAKVQLHRRVEVLKYYAKYMYLMKLKDSELGVRPSVDNYNRSLIAYSPEEVYLHRNASYINRTTVKQTLEVREWKKAHPSYRLITKVAGIIGVLSLILAILVANPKIAWVAVPIPMVFGIACIALSITRQIKWDSKNSFDEKIYPLDELLREESNDTVWMENLKKNVDHLIWVMQTALRSNAEEYYPQIEAEEPKI